MVTVVIFVTGLINLLFGTTLGLWVNYQSIELPLGMEGVIMMTWFFFVVTAILYAILTGREFFSRLWSRNGIFVLVFFVILVGVTYFTVKPYLDYSMLGKPPSEMTLDEKLINASMMEDFEDMRDFLGEGSNVNVLDKDGKSVGMLVIEYNFDSTDAELLEIVRFLVGEGLDLNVEDFGGKTIFDYAKEDAEFESGPEIVEFLESVKTPT